MYLYAIRDKMKRLSVLLVFYSFCPSLFAQATTDIAAHIRWGTTLPTSCTPNNGDIFFKTAATIGAYECLSANTWTQFATGSGSGDVVGPGSATDNAIAIWDGVTGKLLKNSGCTIVSNSLTCGSGSGVAGTIDLTQGTLPSSFPANSFSLYAPTSIVTAYQWRVPIADAAGVLHSDGAGTPGVLSLSTIATVDIASNAVTSAKQAVVNTRRVCSMVVGSDNAAAVLADADIGPQGNQCFIPFAATVVEIDVQADSGTPNVIPRLRHCSVYTAAVCSTWTTADFVSGALAAATGGFPACSKTTGVTGLDGGTTCSGTLQNTAIAIGDWIELKSGTAGGAAKRLSIDVIYLVN